MFYCDGKLKRACNIHGLIQNAQLQAAVNCSSICTLHVVMEITNAKPCQSSEVWSAAECHCLAARFLLHMYFKISSSLSMKALNTLINNTEYTIKQ
jgi:hypothetical protein